MVQAGQLLFELCHAVLSGGSLFDEFCSALLGDRTVERDQLAVVVLELSGERDAGFSEELAGCIGVERDLAVLEGVIDAL